MKMTRALLEKLGSCGDYTRVFRRLFPVEQYPLGVEVNEEVCLANHADFSWTWAVEQMLTNVGYEAYLRAYRELGDEATALNTEFNEQVRAWRQEWNQRYNEPDWDTGADARSAFTALKTAQNERLREAGLTETQRQARAFGRVFDQHPELRRNKVAQAEAAAVDVAEKELIRSFDRVERNLVEARENLEHWTAKVPEFEAALAEITTAAASARASQATKNADTLAQQATDALKIAEEAQAAAVEARNKADQLTTEATALTEAATSETTVSENTTETPTDDTASGSNEAFPQEEVTSSSAS